MDCLFLFLGLYFDFDYVMLDLGLLCWGCLIDCFLGLMGGAWALLCGCLIVVSLVCVLCACGVLDCGLIGFIVY